MQIHNRFIQDQFSKSEFLQAKAVKLDSLDLGISDATVEIFLDDQGHISLI